MMKNFYNNNNDGDSSIYLGILQAEDLSAQEKLNALKGAADELARQDLLRRLECESQVSSCVDEVSSQATLAVEQEDEDYFTDRIDSLLKKLFEFLKPAAMLPKII
jgi:ribosome assembly protein YihI (activator of Der GTPase)